MNFRLGELFCGPGGMAIAAARTPLQRNKITAEEFSISHLWGVDYSKSAIETFKTNLPEAEGLEIDACEFTRTGLTPGRKIDALAFGFPCNSFSNVGERQGINSKQYGHLYKEGIKVLEAYAPQWFIAENVSGISGHESGSQFLRILQELADSGKGYNVTAHLYKFEKYGVPQSRHRYVIVGIRSDIAKRRGLCFKIPAPTLKNPVSAQEALSKVKNTTEWGKAFTRQGDKVFWRLIFTPPGENAWKLDEIIKYDDTKLEDYLRNRLPWYESRIKTFGSMSTIRSKIEYARLHVKTKARMSHIYRRLHPDEPAYTITGSGGGGTHVYHWEEPRALTNEERAALQTFPPDFVFKGSKEEIRKQIGMAVPTAGAIAIFTAILKTFAGITYESIEADSRYLIYPKKK